MEKKGSEVKSENLNTTHAKTRLVIPAGILRIPVFSIPVPFFSQES
jgi:hypothetical protein